VSAEVDERQPIRIADNTSVTDDQGLHHFTAHRSTSSSMIGAPLAERDTHYPATAPRAAPHRSKLTIAPAAIFTAHPCPTGRLS
jgi:hypothetical protein